MIKKFVSLLAAMAVVGGGAALWAQAGAKAGEGTLMLEDKNYTLSHALAYETTVNGEDAIAVVLSGQTISGEDLKKSKEEEKKGGFASFKRPFLILDFSKAGQLKFWSAAAGGTSIGRREAGKATGELKLQDGRASGKASQPRDAEGMFPTAFDVRFDVKLLAAGETLPTTVKKAPGPAANVKPTVTGTFKGNGKEGNIAFVSAQWQEPFSGKAGMKLVFTEKDHSKVKKPDFDAAFGKLGSALVISVFEEDGGIYGCQVVHSAHKKQGFSSIGQIRTNNFKFDEGKVEGELVTDSEIDTFGEKWEVNLKFVAPLGEIPKEFQVPDSKKQEETAKEKPSTKTTEADSGDDDEDGDDDSEKPASKPAKDQLNVKDLALTKDATDFDYKTGVEHLNFKSPSSTKAVCTELSANLKAQGWKNDGSDLITPASSILKRKREGASLTVFVKPDGTGSKVQMMTEGLSWEGQ
ncbi:MAG TPA: hypothetical protein VEX43_06000 [Chthoniobacterales bacterium]|nr:hypothetical protein [Chthoniobacterales bacterium]